MRILLAALLLSACVARADDPAPFVKFDAQEIDHTLKIGYAVKVADLNADGKPDIIVVDKHRVIWFENPGRRGDPWKLHTILEGTTKPDNVCLDVLDIDNDGKLDIALGAGWNPPNTTDPGTIQWLKQPANIDEPWKLYPIGEEPSVHRMRFVDFGDGKKRLLVAPLQGKGATAKANWMDHGPRLVIYEVPKDPTSESWKAMLVTDQLHVVHNFAAIAGDARAAGLDYVFASYEGLTGVGVNGSGNWLLKPLVAGDQDHPNGSRGCSEVKFGHLSKTVPFIVTIEPWHGNQVVVYTAKDYDMKRDVWNWDRHVIDKELKWGHGLWCCDLDGDGNDEIVVGVRDPLTERVRSSVNVFKATKPDATEWQKQVIDNGGVATENLTCADLDGDGKIDIVAVGRATGNVKVYWNQTGK